MIKKLAMGIILCMTVPAAAFAQGYIEAGAGNASTATDCTGMDACKDSSTGFKVSAGYLFNERFGLEAVYFDMGKMTALETRLDNSKIGLQIKTTGYGGGLLGLAPVGTNWVFNYRIGILQAKSARDITLGSSSVLKDSRTSTAVYLGLGGGYNMTPNFTVAVVYDFFNAKDANNQSYTNKLLSLNARYKF